MPNISPRPSAEHAPLRIPVCLAACLFAAMLQWPTLVTLLMFPILVPIYVRLAHREEREMQAELGESWNAYAQHTPGFIPGLSRRGSGIGDTRSAHG